MAETTQQPAAAPTSPAQPATSAPPAAGAGTTTASGTSAQQDAAPEPILSEAKPTGEATTATGDQGQAVDASKDKGGDQAGEIKLTLPEGVKVDETLWKSFQDTAQKAGVTLNSESASKIATWWAEQQTAQQKAMTTAWQQQDTTWRDELKGDPEFGGAKYDANVANARRGFSWAGAEFSQFVKEAGLANHPVLVKLCARLGVAVAEDSARGSGAGAGILPDPNEALRQRYPSMFNPDGSAKG